MLKEFSLLIPDGESHLSLYVVNCLLHNPNVTIYVMANQKYPPIRYSRGIKKFFYYPDSGNDLEFISKTNEILERYDIDLLMPVFETGIKKISMYKDKFDHNKLGLIPSIKDFDIAISKWTLSKHMELTDIPYPKSYMFVDIKKNNFNQFEYPVIMKPTYISGGGDGVMLFKKVEELKAYVSKDKFNPNQLIQEYIDGFDVGCSLLCKSGEILACTMQKASMLNNNPFRPWLGVQFLYNEELFNIVENLMRSLNWNGVAHLDLKFDKKSNTFKVIEINPRFWGSLEGSMIAGVNFPYLYCLASLDKKFDTPDYEKFEYFNLKGLGKKIKINKRLLFNWKCMNNYTQLRYVVKNPIPVVIKYAVFFKTIVRSRFS
ncbi:ATP-grasp domain-containing protein [Winogradskyella sp. SYSU M77433]|uniref:ATP-grasp domain-containing protein n=1 Tax=Winogradskyella sp. SYSU M77433 TaxID=3042722 RepID=UPI00247FA96E|nr:ATP-grasp domain-containing protein [Winogradskyella sp. SYSU M77433]MDH7914426.1 ATP-grasp domain-containing protein [Winogradskyella sp. SYSU M77433]